MSGSPPAGRPTVITPDPRPAPDTADESAGVAARRFPTPMRLPRELPGRQTPAVVVQVSPARLEWLEALAEGDDVFTERFGIAVETGWAGFPEALPAAVETARRRPEDDPWGTHVFFADDGALVGLGGFYGPPVDGMVEIGYAVAPSRQGQGIATAAVDTLLARAAEAGVPVVIAHTLAEVNPSTSVLGRTGFVRTSAQDDPDLGEVWRWEHVTG